MLFSPFSLSPNILTKMTQLDNMPEIEKAERPRFLNLSENLFEINQEKPPKKSSKEISSK